jgi:hypothetical protein
MKDNPNLVHGQSADALEKGEIDAMKERLRDYRSMNKEIENQIERLERMEMKISSIGSPVLSDMPKSPSTAYDRMASSVARKVDFENEIKELIAERDSECRSLESLIRQLKKPDERAVIRMRYLDIEDWEDILMMIFGGQRDFNDKYDNYKQRMFRLHSAAISNMAALSH